VGVQKLSGVAEISRCCLGMNNPDGGKQQTRTYRKRDVAFPLEISTKIEWEARIMSCSHLIT
jgi:hypothetical protein